ncbi:zona pellucida-binding protein 2 [Rhincodon typus]|uniref:zona pellucida-binding protein 2 n=1 Tax=Rhincodon typus TaxID=259920 RepID=UPI00202F5480|nr:zona pellucida-binding protein 2 [Rhincodon typus]
MLGVSRPWWCAGTLAVGWCAAMRSMGAGTALRLAALAIVLSARPGRATGVIDITHIEHIQEIYGNSNRPVKVYVKMYHDSPALLCTTQELAEKELVDPYFIWVGPSGRNIKGEPYVRISETGGLILRSFDKFMSGDYTCTVSYKDVEKNKEIFLDMKFSAYGKHRNTSYFLFKPTVDPFGYGWEEVCRKFIHDCEDETNRRVEKARNRIEAFFKKQRIALDKMKDNMPTFYYIANSLKTVRVDHCRPGFGKNKLTHLDCSECCVVCDHGMYNPNNDVFCRPCTSVKINYYGATAC